MKRGTVILIVLVAGLVTGACGSNDLSDGPARPATEARRPTSPSTVVETPLPDPTTTAPSVEVVPEPVEEPIEDGYPIEGVAADEPEIFLAELEALRNSAGPGRIVGFVHLQDPDHTFPIAETQPYCVGAGDFEDITPGLVVTIHGDGAAGAEQTTILRGSVVDAHTGCSIWFGEDVTDADS